LHEAHFRSALNLKEELTRIGLEHDWLTGANESLVTRARNEMTASFLGTRHSHMMWLDADIEFEAQDVAKLWNLDADIAVGAYAMKKPGETWYAAWVKGQLVKDLDRFEEPVEADYAGTGFMLIKREVIEKLAQDAPEYQAHGGSRVRAIYQTPVHEGVFDSEDFHFCRIAKKAGFEILLEPSVRLKHWGQSAYGP
jgi:hypothetical protein